MDPATAARLAQAIGRDIASVRSLGGQHGVRHYRLELTGGMAAFAKVHKQLPDRNGAVSPTTDDPAAARQATADPDRAGFAAEAAGLGWLAAAESVPVPAVLGFDASCLILEWVDSGGSSPDAAARFGRDLAGLHRAGSARFGAPWPGMIAGLVLPNGAADSWPDWYAANRVLPYARLAADGGFPQQGRRRADRVGVRAVVAASRAARAPQPHSRRLLVGQCAVVRRPRLADRPGRPRRSPGD